MTRILARLPTNEVPGTARLVCKAAAAALSSPKHTTVRLSQPSPHGEFVRRWGAPGAMRPLTRKRRRRLLALTAASGCLHNLAWLVEHAGCFPIASVLEALAAAGVLEVAAAAGVLEAAAAAGRLEVCRWLLQQGCDGLSAALAAAAGAGQRSTLEAFLADPGTQNPCRDTCRGGAVDPLLERLSWVSSLPDALATNLASCAARGGHVGLMDWLLERFTPRHAGWEKELLVAAAVGCDLATLQRLHRTHQPQLAQLEQLSLRRLLGCAAASSRTPDWKAKVEWVEASFGTPLYDTIACAGAAGYPDALERLTWLGARGCPWDSQAVTSAAGGGNVGALSYLLAEGCEVHYLAALRAAAAGGHLAALEVLHAHGRAATDPESWAAAAAAAARKGQLPAVRWMLERQLIELQPPAAAGIYRSLLSAAAESGSIELLAWLHAGGCRWGERGLYAAARGGSEEALQWAVAQGCPVQESRDENDDPYLIAARQGDWGTLACLRRLAVPWRPLARSGGTFKDAVLHCCSVPILRRLLELGCPVDWLQVAGAAKPRGAYVRAWLREEQQRREVPGAPGGALSGWRLVVALVWRLVVWVRGPAGSTGMGLCAYN